MCQHAIAPKQVRLTSIIALVQKSCQLRDRGFISSKGIFASCVPYFDCASSYCAAMRAPSKYRAFAGGFIAAGDLRSDGAATRLSYIRFSLSLKLKIRHALLFYRAGRKPEGRLVFTLMYKRSLYFRPELVFLLPRPRLFMDHDSHPRGWIKKFLGSHGAFRVESQGSGRVGSQEFLTITGRVR